MKTIFYFISFIFCTELQAQVGNLHYGGSGDDCIFEMIPSHDGNFYTVGSKTEGTKKIWLQKLNTVGSVIWERTYAPSDNLRDELGYSVNISQDGSLIITGEQREIATFPGQFGLALKVDANGSQVWKKIYQDVSAIFDAHISNSDIHFVGWSDNTGSSDSGILLITNINGVIIDQIEINIANQNFVKKIIQLSDGNFLIAGRANVIGVGYEGVFLQKISPDGTRIWSVTHDTGFSDMLNGYNDEDYYRPLGVLLQPDGNIWVTNPKDNQANIALMRFTLDGEFKEEKVYGDPDIIEFPYAIDSTDNNELLISGSTLEGKSFVLKVTKEGLEVNRKYYSKPNSVVKAYDIDFVNNHYVISGQYQEDALAASDFDGWLLIIEQNGNAYPNKVKGKVIFDVNDNCQYDTPDKPLQGMFIQVASTDRFDTLMSNRNGEFEYFTDPDINEFSIYNNNLHYLFCNNSFTVESSNLNPLDSVLFLVRSDEQCPYLELGLTQPDLIRCDTSCFTATILNNGNVASQNLILTVRLEKTLSLISVSTPFTTHENEVYIDVESVPLLSGKNIDICVALDCDIQLGATHEIEANVRPYSCEGPYGGPWYHVTGDCKNDIVRFRLWNSGGGGILANSEYNVYADGLLIAENVFTYLPENGSGLTLDFPADGRTWRVDVKQAEGVPELDFPSVSVEGCGKLNNGLHSIGFRNAWRANDLIPQKCILRIPNSDGVPNKVAEAVLGLGNYNVLNDKDRLEFTARIKNTTAEEVSQIDFDLSLNAAIDPRTFKLMSYPGSVSLSFPQHNTVRVTLNEITIVPGDDAMIRFSCSPRENVQPDAGPGSVFVVECNAYLEGKGPVTLAYGFNNFSLTVPTYVDEYNDYSPGIELFGGKNIEFGITIAKGSDNSVFMTGESDSYGARGNFDGYVVKINRNGLAEWLMAFDAGTMGFNTIHGIASLPDGGCMVSGNAVPAGEDITLGRTRIFVSRISKDGKLLWTRFISPNNEMGAWSNGMIKISDQEFLIYGYAKNGGNDQFYLKIDEEGNVIWNQFLEVTGSAFRPSQGILTSDGGCVFLGSNESTIINYGVFVEKIDSEGNIVWNQGYDSEHGIYLGDIAEATDGGFIIAGFSQWSVSVNDYVITPTFIKISSGGNFEWEKNPIVGPNRIAEPSCIDHSPNGGFVVGGEIFADTTEHFTDMMLMKIDENGEVEWYKNYGTKNYESTDDILAYSADEIFLWGNNQDRPPLYNLQAILVKTNGEGISATQIPENHLPDHSTWLYPNPSNNEVNIVLSPQPITSIAYVLVDITGRILDQGKSTSTNSIQLNISNVEAGTYFISFPGSLYPGKQLVVIH